MGSATTAITAAATIKLNNAKSTGFTNYEILSKRPSGSIFQNVSGIYKASIAVSSVVISFSVTTTAGTYFVYGA